jgi:predicted porin
LSVKTEGEQFQSNTNGETLIMNRKILTMAVAAALAAPMAAHADVRLSGLIQAEAASLEGFSMSENAYRVNSDGNIDEDMDRQMLTNDSFGAIVNEGPNAIQFDFDEKLGGGLTAFARYAVPFNTSNNEGLSGEAEAFVGLRTSSFSFRYGTLEGVYKSSRALIDPWALTSLQASGTGGGMTGEHYNKVSEPGSTNITDPNNTNKYAIHYAAIADNTGMTNEGFVDGAAQIGAEFGGFSAQLQYVIDERSNMNGAGLVELRYSAPSFAIWAAASLADMETAAKDQENDGGNWKIGGQFKLGPAKLGIQYEEAEIGVFDGQSDGGKYILGSIELTKNNITFAGWIGQYISDIENRMADKAGNPMDEDAFSWAVGGKYHFSKRTQLYAGYRLTDSDNDYRDEDIFTLGIRHTF